MIVWKTDSVLPFKRIGEHRVVHNATVLRVYDALIQSAHARRHPTETPNPLGTDITRFRKMRESRSQKLMSALRARTTPTTCSAQYTVLSVSSAASCFVASSASAYTTRFFHSQSTNKTPNFVLRSVEDTSWVVSRLLTDRFENVH